MCVFYFGLGFGFFKANVKLLKLKCYVTKQSNVFLTYSITSSFTLFKNGQGFHRMLFQQYRESFLSHRFSTEPKNTDVGGKKEPITAGISLKGNTKRNTILNSLSAIVVPYIKEIKSSLKCKKEPIYSDCLQVTLHHLLGQFAHTKGNYTKK